MAGIYIHIPFCKKACLYCDFHFSTNLSYQEKMVDAIIIELINRKGYIDNEVIDTIYFGGGTPSLLSDVQLEKILNAVYKYYSVNTNVEITLEANPDDLSKEKLTSLFKNNINRLSIGIQTFDDQWLSEMYRGHNSDQAFSSVRLAQDIGFSNISTDLIYGFPHKNGYLFSEDIEKTLSLETQHLSAYCLTIEKGTALDRKVKKGRFITFDDYVSSDQFTLLHQKFESNNFIHYETSNYALDGMYSKHNTAYWQGKTYLGVGPGAHSFDRKTRQSNIANNQKYIALIEKGTLSHDFFEELSICTQYNEYMMTGLRTIWGIDIAVIAQRYSIDFKSYFKKNIEKIMFNELAFFEKDKFILTTKGSLIADEIITEFFIIE